MGEGEFEKIARLAARFRSVGAAGVLRGIGDDAAVLDGSVGGKLVWTIDEQVEGTHFRRDLVGWADVGFRSFMAAASDVAAMGARPWCALSALALPSDLEDDALDALADGQRLAADRIGAVLVGGNLARAQAVSIATTLLGTCDRPVAREGGVAGDRVWIAGEVGLAGAGLMALVRGAKDRRLRPAVAAWQRPVARTEAGLAMGKVAHAGIDVSDGLAQDAGHLARASGVCVVIDEERLLAHGGAALAGAAAALGVGPAELALHGGEDYALVALSAEAIPGFVEIGEVREGEGVVLRGRAGETALEGGGFDHFGRVPPGRPGSL
jgi:thiamine-monophosphate kinase